MFYLLIKISQPLPSTGPYLKVCLHQILVSFDILFFSPCTACIPNIELIYPLASLERGIAFRFSSLLAVVKSRLLVKVKTETTLVSYFGLAVAFFFTLRRDTHVQHKCKRNWYARKNTCELVQCKRKRKVLGGGGGENCSFSCTWFSFVLH